MTRFVPSSPSTVDGAAALSRPSVAVLRGRGASALPLALMLVAVVIWTVTVSQVDPQRISDLGLVSVLPVGAFAALGIAVVSLALLLSCERLSTAAMLVYFALLLFMLYGATPLFQEVPAFNVLWRHAGVTDFISAHGRVDPRIDAYFSWPGFFFWAALVSHTAAAHSVLQWSAWAPVAFELAYLPPLYVIARAFTPDRRLAWSAIWIFYVANWVGQDYLSPQAMAYLWYLAIMAALLTYLGRRDEQPARATPGRQAAIVAICIVMTAAAVASHQLTPWMILGGTAALVVFGRCSARGLPGVIALLLVMWLGYMATGYLDGHLSVLLSQTFDVGGSVQANVSNRLNGSSGHLLVVHTRLAMTAGVWLLAGVGLVRRLRGGDVPVGHAILALSTPVFAVLQPYGGEMLMRVFLFSLPFLACFAAAALAPVRGWSWRAAAVVAGTGAVLLAGFVVSRYGNVASTIFTPGEVRTAERLYDIAPRGALLVAASANVAWRQEHYGDYHYQLLANHLLPPQGSTPARPRQLAREAAAYMASADSPAYLLLTRSQLRYDELLGSQPWGSVAALRAGVERSPQFKKVFDNGDGQIFRLLPRKGRA